MTPADARTEGLRRRRALTRAERDRYSQRICERIVRCSWYRRAEAIAIYLAAADEVSLLPLLQAAWSDDKIVAAPIVKRNFQLRFAVVTPATRLRRNRYGIAEPMTACRFDSVALSVRAFDLVCAPLSAFDAQLHRVGMGGGYYDRALSRRRRTPRQYFLGTAFECQRLRDIESAAWDVPLDGVVTESSLLLQGNGSRLLR